MPHSTDGPSTARTGPLTKTISNLLVLALLYMIFPLGHFSILLPLAAILVALMADWSRFHLTKTTIAETVPADTAPAASDAADRERTDV
ncbi:hypothetical protein ACEWPM_012795 [Roseovarius sp. S4756]|uniref:hypothetical protein n=1 Tax=Roseovarius maritimus TaxID=3342637 RepID=UPI00372B66B2